MSKKMKRYKSRLSVDIKCEFPYCDHSNQLANAYPCNNCKYNNFLRSHDKIVARDYCTNRYASLEWEF